MRFVIGCLAGLMATSAMADEFDVQSEVSTVIASPSGGIITRSARVSLPAGQHRVTILGASQIHGDAGNGIDFPVGSGLSLIAASSKPAIASEPLYLDTEEYKELKQSVDAAQRAVHSHQTLQSSQTAIVRAAQTRLTFLEKFASGGNNALSLEQLTDPQLISKLTAQLGDETAKAVVEHAEANRKLETLKTKGDQLEQALARAETRLADFVPDERQEMVLTLDVVADKPFSGDIDSHLVHC